MSFSLEYHEGYQIEIYKGIPPSRHQFTVYNKKGVIIGQGFNCMNRRAALTAAQKFISWYVEPGSLK